MKIKVALLDEDINYLNRLAMVFNTKYADKIEIHSFTNEDNMFESLETEKIELLVASDMFEIDMSKIPSRCGFAYFVETIGIESVKEQKAICKYQKAELIYKQILNIYADYASLITGKKNGESGAKKWSKVKKIKIRRCDNMKKSHRILSMLLVIALFMSIFTFQNTLTVEAKTFKKTGGYSTSLSTKKDKEDKYYSYAKKLVFKSNKFILYGSMHYTKPGDVYSSKIYKKAKRTYILSGKCKYYKQIWNNKTGKPGKKKKISKKALKKLALPLDSKKYSKRTLAWTIKGGKVTELGYREY